MRAAIRFGAIAVLAQQKDKRIHQLAKELISERKIVAENNKALDLSIHNYEPSDATLIMSILQRIHPSIEDIHSLGSSLIDISEEQNDTSLTELLLWVYENTPCMQCRRKSLDQLKKYKGIPKEIWDEIEFDAEESIREFWKSYRSLEPIDK